ncbi:hypothetical protein [Chryseobacterium sp. CT-SW4]|uniref:hypothetical protein n=1 Tax=Chryseobacterium sp. SW-1 TaxID=3157343 RepID=UPI003B01DA68
MKLVYFLIISFLLISCKKKDTLSTVPNNSWEITDTVKVNTALLTLANNKGKGQLRTSLGYKIGGEVKIQCPCYFLRSKEKVNRYSYPEFDISDAVVILGKVHKDSLNKIYGTEIQGVLLKKDSIILTSGVLRNYSPIDKELGVDEKDYWGFASGLYNH